MKFDPFQALFMYGFTSLLFFMFKSIFFDNLIVDFQKYSLTDFISAIFNGLSFGFIQGNNVINLSYTNYGNEI